MFNKYLAILVEKCLEQNQKCLGTNACIISFLMEQHQVAFILGCVGSTCSKQCTLIEDAM